MKVKKYLDFIFGVIDVSDLSSDEIASVYRMSGVISLLAIVITMLTVILQLLGVSSG